MLAQSQRFKLPVLQENTRNITLKKKKKIGITALLSEVSAEARWQSLCHESINSQNLFWFAM